MIRIFSGLVYFYNFVKQCHLVETLILTLKLCCNIFKCILILRDPCEYDFRQQCWVSVEGLLSMYHLVGSLVHSGLNVLRLGK